MIKKFLVSVADAYGYDSDSNLIFVGKTLLDSSIEATLGNADVRAGRGNKLQYVYYHTAELNAKVTDAQWNLDFLAVNVGQDVTTSNNIYTEESVTLTGGAGSVTGTPLAVSGTTIYGWVTRESGAVERVTFSTKAFNVSGGGSETVCVRYYALDSAARTLTIPANIVPKIVRLVLEAQLASSDSTSNIIGSVQIEIPKATLTGAFSIAMKADGVASTPLNVRALATPSTVNGCAGVDTYATITEVITNAHWYDDVIGLAIVGGDFTLPNGGTRQLSVRAVPSSGASFTPPAADLTWASTVTGDATVDATGLVTWISSGASVISVTITAKTSIDANVNVTCSA